MHLDEVTLISNTATANVELGTLLLARINVGHDALERLYTVIFVVERE